MNAAELCANIAGGGVNTGSAGDISAGRADTQMCMVATARRRQLTQPGMLAGAAPGAARRAIDFLDSAFSSKFLACLAEHRESSCTLTDTMVFVYPDT